MTPITLQLALPDKPVLDADRLAEITGSPHKSKQIAWLKEHVWTYELTSKGDVRVGSLYAHLKLAGLHPVDLHTADVIRGVNGFDLSAVR